MSEDEINNLFGEIMGAQDDMPNLDGPAPEERKDGLHYVATVDSVATYDLVVEGRVIFQVLVNEAVAVEIPAVLKGSIHPLATVHQIQIANRDRSIVLPTDGLAVMGKNYLRTDTIRNFVIPRAVKFMILVNRIGL